MAQSSLPLHEICSRLGLDSPTDDINISGIASLEKATSEQLSFFENASYRTQAQNTQAGAVIIRAEDKDVLPQNVIALLSNNPYATYARAAGIIHPANFSAEISKHAVVDPAAKIGKNVHIGAHCYIGPQVEIGDYCYIDANVTINHTTIGSHVLIHPGARLGQDGFGFARDGAEIIKIPQIGRVIIGDHVEIGANTTIDRGALDNTTIGDHTKIDNQVQIAHNVVIGQSCQISGQVGIAGSAKIGNHVIIGGQCGINGHLEITDNVMIAGRSCVTKNITKAGVISGFPAIPIKEWRKQQALISRMSKK